MCPVFVPGNHIKHAFVRTMWSGQAYYYNDYNKLSVHVIVYTSQLCMCVPGCVHVLWVNTTSIESSLRHSEHKHKSHCVNINTMYIVQCSCCKVHQPRLASKETRLTQILTCKDTWLLREGPLNGWPFACVFSQENQESAKLLYVATTYLDNPIQAKYQNIENTISLQSTQCPKNT